MLNIKQAEYEHLKSRDELLTKLLVAGVENTECWKVAKGIGQEVAQLEQAYVPPIVDHQSKQAVVGKTVNFSLDTAILTGVIVGVHLDGVVIRYDNRTIFRQLGKFWIQRESK